jgi:hypothetical protein
MNTRKQTQAQERQPHFPSLEHIQQELGSAKSVDDFFGKEGIPGALGIVKKAKGSPRCPENARVRRPDGVPLCP